MGWSFKAGNTRRQLIDEQVRGWENLGPDGIFVKGVCLAHCYRGGSFAGVLWSVWERTMTKDGLQLEPPHRSITCDVLHFRRESGWGYKDLDESMGPYYFSCPLKYLDLVPIEQYGGHPEWRQSVRTYHEQKRANKRPRVTVQG